MASSFLGAACARARWHLAVAAVLCCEAMVWAVAFLTSPLRLLAAADRERKLERMAGEMRGQTERVVWENTELEKKLRAALEEQAAMERILDEMEEEHSEALARIGVLETQLKALRKENARLIEHKGKSMSDKAAAAADNRGGDGDGDGERAPRQRTWESAGKDQGGGEEEGAVFGAGSGDPYLAADQEARLMRATARRRSLFSLGMSLAVGGIAWSADAPCLPLLTGLLAVAAMSMSSVARLFRSSPAAAAAARRGEAVDGGGGGGGAVELLSLNWFLLGVLTYPMAPTVARAVLPRAGSLAGPAVAWLAAAVPV